MYNIRKFMNGGRRVTNMNKGSALLFMTAPILFFYILYKIQYIDAGEIGNFELIFGFIFCCVFFVVGFIMYRDISNINKAKNLKKTGGGLVKSVKITGFEEYSDRNSRRTGIYIVAEDGDHIYCSETFPPNYYIKTNKGLLTKVYKECGYSFDEEEKDKNDVIRVLENNILEKKFSAESSNFIKKWINKGKEFSYEFKKKSVERGYIPEHLEVGDKKIYIGDMVDVYINPENEKYYWMDIESLFGE